MKNNMRRKITLAVLILIPIIIISVMLIKEFNITFDFRKVQDISFSQLNNMTDIEKLNGKKVRILGYMSPTSPYGYSYVYLSSKPYATDVFEEGKFNSIAVYSKDSMAIGYSNHPVFITGNLVLGDFNDKQGYSYKYRIENAEIVNATIEQVDGLVKKYLLLAQSDILNNLNTIFGQIDMIIYFEEYKELGYIKEENLTKIDIDAIDAIDALTEQVKKYNDETYNTIVLALEQLKTVSNDINKLVDEKKYDKLLDSKDKFEEVYYEFYYYIGEFSV